MKPKPEGAGEYESRTIRNFDLDIGNGVKNYQAQNQPPATQKAKYVPEAEFKKELKENFTESREQYGRRLAIHGMVNGMLAAGIKPTDISLEVISQVDMLENRINNFLKDYEDSGIPF